MLVKYYLSDNIKAPFENFALSLRNVWAGPACLSIFFYISICLLNTQLGPMSHTPEKSFNTSYI